MILHPVIYLSFLLLKNIAQANSYFHFSKLIKLLSNLMYNTLALFSILIIKKILTNL